MNSSSKAAWITDSFQSSSSMPPRSDFCWINKIIFTLKKYFFRHLLLWNDYIYFMNIHALFTEAHPRLASEHTCLPLAAGHGGFVTATAEGGEICSSSCTGGAHPHHQACGPKCRGYTVKFCTCVYAPVYCMCLMFLLLSEYVLSYCVFMIRIVYFYNLQHWSSTSQ